MPCLHRKELCAVFIAATIGLGSTLSLAKSRRKGVERTQDLIIYGKDNALWSAESDGTDERLLTSLPWPAKRVEGIRIASNGTAMVVSIAGYTAWAKLDATTRQTALQFLPCSGAANISNDGNRVVCATQDGKRIAIYTLQPSLSVDIIDYQTSSPIYFGEDSKTVVTLDSPSSIASLEKDAKGLVQKSVVASHRPDQTMMVTPDGTRGLGGYTEGNITVVYSFRLDGKATKRTLVQAARLKAISADSSWAALQQELDACAVRIAGGQYMCWRRYEAIQVSTHGRSLLLSATRKGQRSLYVGTVSGTAASKPKQVLRGVERVAAFWPRPHLDYSTTDPEEPEEQEATKEPEPN